MAWVKKDTGYVRNHKVLALSYEERWHHEVAMAWVAENATDGEIPRHALAAILPEGKRGERMLCRLVEVGLWDQFEDHWVIHDWLVYNLSGARAKELRDQRAKRQQRWRANRGASRDASTGASTPPSTPTSTTTSQGASTDASGDALRDHAIARKTRPDPTRDVYDVTGQGRGEEDGESSTPPDLGGPASPTPDVPITEALPLTNGVVAETVSSLLERRRLAAIQAGRDELQDRP